MTSPLEIPQVTLCAASCVNVSATIAALTRCMAQVRCARVLLFSDAQGLDLPPGIELIAIPGLKSSADYSRFVLHDLVQWIETTHCLIAQWDGFVTDSGAWNPAFLDYDYIGAPWPQFSDGHDVGNGGFSMRSKRLMQACQLPGFVDSGEAEDVVIARNNRRWLEQACGMLFANRAIASHFSFERDHEVARTFGFHGVFNLPEAVGIDDFWSIYRLLDDKSTIHTDFWPLLRALASGANGLSRAGRLAVDQIRGFVR